MTMKILIRGPCKRTSTTSILALLALAATGARTQTIPTVPQSECAPQFQVNGIVVSGCTTVASPSANQPYCVLATPRNGSKLGFCNTDTIRPRFAKSSDGTVPCDVSTPVSDLSGVVYGCFTPNAAGGQLMCNSGAIGLVPCFLVPPTTPSSPSSPGQPSTTDTATVVDDHGGKGLSAIVIILIVLGGGLVPFTIFALLFFRRRRRAAEGDSLEKFSLDNSPRVISTMSPRRMSTMDPAGNSMRWSSGEQASNNSITTKKGARTSSQYGFNGTPPLGDGSAAIPTMPSQKPLGKYIIASTYTPTLSDEIVVQPGDIVEVYQEFDDGWCAAINVSRGLARGVFPLHCIDDTSEPLAD